MNQSLRTSSDMNKYRIFFLICTLRASSTLITNRFLGTSSNMRNIPCFPFLNVLCTVLTSCRRSLQRSTWDPNNLWFRISGDMTIFFFFHFCAYGVLVESEWLGILPYRRGYLDMWRYDQILNRAKKGRGSSLQGQGGWERNLNFCELTAFEL